MVARGKQAGQTLFVLALVQHEAALAKEAYKVAQLLEEKPQGPLISKQKCQENKKSAKRMQGTFTFSTKFRIQKKNTYQLKTKVK